MIDARVKEGHSELHKKKPKQTATNIITACRSQLNTYGPVWSKNLVFFLGGGSTLKHLIQVIS